MRSISICAFVLYCCAPCVAGDDQADVKEKAEVRQVFTCPIYHPGWKDRVRIIETAQDYAALRKKVSEITFPEPGVRRASSRMLRELDKFDFKKHRLVLICSTSMADEIRVVSADPKEIRVRNIPTFANAISGSAQLVALAAPREPKPPQVSWVDDPSDE